MKDLRGLAIALGLAVVLVATAGIVLEAAFRAGRITVTTTATALYTAPARSGVEVQFCNRGAAAVYIGGDNTLTTANGFELAAAACVTLKPYQRESIWWIIGAGTATVHWVEGYR